MSLGSLESLLPGLLQRLSQGPRYYSGIMSLCSPRFVFQGLGAQFASCSTVVYIRQDGRHNPPDLTGPLLGKGCGGGGANPALLLGGGGGGAGVLPALFGGSGGGGGVLPAFFGGSGGGGGVLPAFFGGGGGGGAAVVEFLAAPFFAGGGSAGGGVDCIHTHEYHIWSV